MKVFFKLLFLLGFGVFFLFLFWQFLSAPKLISEPEILQHQKLQCASYSPFIKEEEPYDFILGLKIPQSRLDEDLKILSRRFKCIRTYSMTGMEKIPEIAKKYGMEIYLGIWIGRNAQDNKKEIKKAVEIAKAHPEVIRAIIVGNEVLLRREQTVEGLRKIIEHVKAEMPHMLVTYADVWEFWIRNKNLASAVDFITIHILPYWENNPIGIEGAIEHVKNVYDRVALEIPGKDILIGESGWPSEGRPREDAVPSTQNEARFVRGFVNLAEKNNWKYNLIEAFDQPWKKKSEGTVGGYWGLYDGARNEKAVFDGPVSNYPHVKFYFHLSVFIFVVGLALTWPQWKNNFSSFSIIFVLAIAQSLWWREALVANRYYNEWLTTVVVSVLSAGVLINFFWKNLSFINFFILFTAVLSVHTALGLVFDGRYREIPWLGFLMPMLLSSACFLKLPPHYKKEINPFFGLVALLLAVAHILIEGVVDFEPIIFSALLAFLGITLMWKRYPRLFYKNRILFFLLFFFMLACALGLRFGLMESEALSAVCADGNGLGLCGVRDKMGMLIHFKFWALISLFPILFGVFTHRLSLIRAGLILTPLGLTMYSVDLTAWGFLLALISQDLVVDEALSEKNLV